MSTRSQFANVDLTSFRYFSAYISSTGASCLPTRSSKQWIWIWYPLLPSTWHLYYPTLSCSRPVPSCPRVRLRLFMCSSFSYRTTPYGRSIIQNLHRIAYPDCLLFRQTFLASRAKSWVVSWTNARRTFVRDHWFARSAKVQTCKMRHKTKEGYQ